jgi:hypothetical protein
MEQSPSWKANSHAASQEISHLLCPESSLPCSKEPATDFYPLRPRGPVQHFVTGWLLTARSCMRCLKILYCKDQSYSRAGDSSSASEMIPFSYEFQRLITVFTRDRQWPTFWARWIQSIASHTVSLRSVSILGLTSGSFHSHFSIYNFSSLQRISQVPPISSILIRLS